MKSLLYFSHLTERTACEGMRPLTRTKCKEYRIMKKITRRQFLTSAGATSAALLLSSLPHAAAADENCLRKVTPAATNSNDLSWDMAEEILTPHF